MKLHEAGTAGVLACEFAGRLAPSTNGGRDSARTRRRKRPARKCSPISRCESSCRYRRTKKRVRLPRPVRHERGEGRGEGCLTTANRLTIAKRLLSPFLCLHSFANPVFSSRCPRAPSTPTALRRAARAVPQPRWGCVLSTLFPRVARPSQPWAGGRNPVGILHGNCRNPLLLTRTFHPQVEKARPRRVRARGLQRRPPGPCMPGPLTRRSAREICEPIGQSSAGTTRLP